MHFSSIWPIDRTLSGATTPGQSGPGSYGNEGVVCIRPKLQHPWNLTISLVLYPGHSLRGRGSSLCRGAVSEFYSTRRMGKLRLHFCKEVRPQLDECYGYDIKLSKGETSVMEFLLPSLLWPGVTVPNWYNGSKRTVWHLNCGQNDWCLIELLKIELFDHLTVCKQMIDV